MSDWSQMVQPLITEAMADINRQAAEAGAVDLRYEGLSMDETGKVTVTFAALVPRETT